MGLQSLRLFCMLSVYQAYYGELCNPAPAEGDATTECVDDNTACRDDGTMQNMFRCTCDEKYMAVKPEDAYQCGK